jgi:hypothetical protein
VGFAPLCENAVKVDSGVPMPGKMAGRKPERIYPWIEMHIGDSFFVPLKQSTVARAAYNAGIRYALKFSTRAVTENGIAGTRVWRTA